MACNRKGKIDWTAIEADYRATGISIRAIAAAHGCTDKAVRKRAKRDRWVRRELKAKVDKATRQALISYDGPQSAGSQSAADTPTDPPKTNEAIVDDAARTQVAVLVTHRKRVRETTALVLDLIDELRGQTRNAAALEELIELVFSSPTPNDAANRSALKRALSLGNRATTATNLANALCRLIALERQAFGLGNVESEPPADPVKREAERSATEEQEGLTDEKRLAAVLNLFEKVARRKHQEEIASNSGAGSV